MNKTDLAVPGDLGIETNYPRHRSEEEVESGVKVGVVLDDDFGGGRGVRRDRGRGRSRCRRLSWFILLNRVSAVATVTCLMYLPTC